MNKHILRNSSKDASVALEACQVTPPNAERPHAGAEMARVLGTMPFHMALDSSGAGIAHWKHAPLHDVIAPMSHPSSWLTKASAS
jgi:AraC family transcriptional regulator